MEYNYNKDRELVLLPDRIAWRDCLSPEEEASYREYLSQAGSTKDKVGNRGVECRISFVERFAGAFVLSFLGSTYKGRTYRNHLSSIT